MSEFQLSEKTSMSVFLALITAFDAMNDISRLPLPDSMRESAIEPYVITIKMITIMTMMDKNLDRKIKLMMLAKIPKLMPTWETVLKHSQMQERKALDDPMFSEHEPENLDQAATYIRELMK